MKKINYLEEIIADISDYICENYQNLENYIKEKEIDNCDDLHNNQYEDCFNSDCITGNLSGSYTFCCFEAEENIAHCWDLLSEALDEFDYQNINILEKGAEWCDVLIRCYLLPEAISNFLIDHDEEVRICEELN